jgi:hypothetical protein
MRLLAVQPINIIIDDLHTTINSEIGSREQLQNLSALVSIQAFQEIATRLAKMRRILNIQRYNLVFIGQVGAGKTTAICHLLNLVQTVAVERTLRSGKKVTIDKTQELLSTGAGKSTICEVVIRPAKFTYIEIDPYPAIELQQLIEEFGLWIWQKAHPATAKIRVEIPPDELLRAIRNIVELPEIIVNGKIQDCALGFASHFASDRYLEFKDELIDRGKLSARTATKIQPQTEDVDEKSWLTKIFQSLNVAKLNNFSIPKRIYLNLSAKILSFDHQRIGNIIDTRGLDLATKDRRDLAEYIRESDESICIFTERFPSAPANVMQIIAKYLTPTAKDLNTKFALLVMPRKGEPEKVIGADGLAVDDLTRGLALRKANIDNVFSNEQINFPFDNILFYDALQGYLGDGSLDRSDESIDIDGDRQQVFADIERVIVARERQLVTEIQTLTQQVEQIRTGKDFAQFENEIILVTHQKVREFSNLNLGKNSFTNDYVDLLPAHHCTLRATNNRYGQYELRDIDIYFNGRYLAEHLIRQSTEKSKSALLAVINEIETEISHGSTALMTMMHRLRAQIDENYEALAIDLGVEIETILSDRLLAPQDYDNSIFWQQAIDRWGQGAGYKVDVLSLYSQQVSEIDATFTDLIQTAWNARIIQPILIFLGDRSATIDDLG